MRERERTSGGTILVLFLCLISQVAHGDRFVLALLNALKNLLYGCTHYVERNKGFFLRIGMRALYVRLDNSRARRRKMIFVYLRISLSESFLAG